jgi:hypothetical protein
LNKYLLLVQQIFDDLNLEAAKAATSVSYDMDAGKPFRFSDFPTLTQRAKDLQQRYVDEIGAVIYSGTSKEWKRSNEVQDLLADGVLKAYGAQVNGDRYKIYYQPNNDALKAFQKRRANGMTLSQKLWNQARNYKEEMEYAISSAIEKGTSAVTLSKRLSKYLHDFPSLQKDYKDKFGKAVDCHDCEYRSMRLARSEINMSYRTAEQTRWQQMDFVVGYEIKLSGAHPAEDICDMLKGKYPKDFVWTGWHPNDLCYKIPILKTEEEFWNYGDAKDKPSSKEVKDVPDAFKKWVGQNTVRISKAKKAGTLPYFLKDNKSYVDKALATYKPSAKEKSAIRQAARTQEQIDKIRAEWAKRRIRQLNDYLLDGHLPDEVYETTGRMYVLLYSKKYEEIQRLSSPLIRAAERHKARTKKQIESIKARWNERKEAMKLLQTGEEKFIANDWAAMRQRSNIVAKYNTDESLQESLAKNFDVLGFSDGLESLVTADGGTMYEMTITRANEKRFEFEWRGWSKDGEPITLCRSFSIDRDGKLECHHDLFAIPESMQGKGFSRKVFQMLYKEYQRMGVDYITVFANIDVGGYCWAKYGFKAKNHFNAVSCFEGLSDDLLEKALNFIDDYYKTNNLPHSAPFPMKLIAQQPWGKDALLNSSWSGILDLSDKAEREFFEKYMFSR